MSIKRLTAKQEAFALNIFQGLTQREAWIKAGYSDNYVLPWIDSHACRLANSVKIQTRLQELRGKIEDNAIATVEERQKRLTELIRADLVDFIGEDGDPKLTRDIPHHQAASEFSTTTRYTKDGLPIIRKSIKIRDPIAAISELNKMEHIYETGGNIRDINVVFIIGKGYQELPPSIEGEVKEIT